MLRQGADEGNIAAALSGQGKKQESLEWFKRSLEHLQNAESRMQRPSPRSRNWLVNTFSQRATTMEQLARFPEAIADWQQAEKLASQGEQAGLQLRRALCLAQSGHPEAAVAVAAEVTSDAGSSGELLLGAARVLARAATVTSKLKEEYLLRSIDLLRSAEKTGYFHTAERLTSLQDDPHLESIRSHSLYQEWRAQLRLTDESARPRTP